LPGKLHIYQINDVPEVNVQGIFVRVT